MALSKCSAKTDAQGRELIEHGTALFPIGCYHDDLKAEAVPWHWHEEIEAGIVTEGQAVIAIGTEKYMLKQGEGFFINSGGLHAAWSADTSNCRMHSLVFHPRLVGGGMDSIFWQRYLQPLLSERSWKGIFLYPENPWNQKALEMIELAWNSCVTEPEGFEFQVRHALSQLIFLLHKYRPTPQKRLPEKAMRDGERMKVMLQYIQEHYRDEISTTQIAQSAMISVSECLRCFRNTINTTPISYVKQFRVQKAADLLTLTNWKVAEIGMQCGFQEMSYFAKSFREMKGCTPSEYRKEMQMRER